VVLSADVLDTMEVGKSLRAVWARHRRWSMMRRRLGGRLYAGELFVGPLPWFALAMASPSVGLKSAAAVLLAARWGGEFFVSRSWGRRLDWRDMALLPVRDLGAAAVFLAGLLGRVVAWRGRPMVIGRDTQITRGAA
jgi:ceramide glucosyltransferase